MLIVKREKKLTLGHRLKERPSVHSSCQTDKQVIYWKSSFNPGITYRDKLGLAGSQVGDSQTDTSGRGVRWSLSYVPFKFEHKKLSRHSMQRRGPVQECEKWLFFLKYSVCVTVSFITMCACVCWCIIYFIYTFVCVRINRECNCRLKWILEKETDRMV